MAAEPTRIKLKRSTTATVVPTTSNLADGEVAVNIADRKIYVRNGGSIVEVANQKPNTGEVTTAMLATDITNGPGNTYYVATVGSDSNTLASSGANGKHPDTPFLTVAKALSLATSGDTVNIAAGTYQEVFPLTVPDGVTVRGANLRSTQITPTPATNDLNAFILEGDSHVSDLTVKDFFYNSGNDTGYGFVCASGLDSDRSPYVERVTVLTKGSVTSGSDPYGFAQGDAGRGAKIDGSLFSSNAIESAVLFNEVTFIVPNSVGLYGTNGARVEWLNSFVYFAAEGIKGVQGATGRAGAGQTRLKLAGVSGSFGATETIYQLADSFQSGTYSRTGTTVTITKNSHGCQNGDVIYADFISGAGTDGYYTVANVAANTFDITDTASGTTSGNVTYKKADAYGVIASTDGTYLYINGKGTGEFTTGVPTGKVGVIAGDAQLDTAQQKFGTASLLLDGVTDHLSFPTDEDFGFGTTNFAIECFIRPTAVTGTQYFLDFRDGSASDTAPVLYLDGSTLHFAVGNTSQISGGTLSAGTWYHVAAARSGGTTKLFLDGTEIGTYSDSNDYGATKPLGVGGEYAGTNEFGGHIDEIRVSKAAARYTAAFTAPTAAFTTDLYTVLLLHFDGTDGSTTITDSGKGVKDIRSSGGDSATSLLTTDYSQFGLELRSISSANIYGTKGAIADGAGVKLLLTSHNFAYIGSGPDFTNDPDLAVPANEVTELNGGRVFYSATNEKGDFRIGDAFIVDQETGNVQFQSTSTAQQAANITLSDGTGTTRIFPAFVETGNLRLSGNTISSTSGSIIIDPSSNEDITLNAEVIIPEQFYFDTGKVSGINSTSVGNVSFNVGQREQGGYSSYGFYTTKNLTVYNSGIATVTILDEGTNYAAGQTGYNVVSTPLQVATATAALDTSNGSVKTVVFTNKGSDYTQVPTVTVSAPGGTGVQAVATATLKQLGRIAEFTISDGGSGYTSPTITITEPTQRFIDTELDINFSSDTIRILNHEYEVDDQIVYYNNGGTENIGLTDATTYYVVEVVDDDRFKVSSSQGGAVANLLQAQSEQHYITGIQATANLTVTAGVITGVTVTNPGSGYNTIAATITDATGVDGVVNFTPGYRVHDVELPNKGTGYSSAPSISFANASGDTTGSGAAATTTIGFPISGATVTDSGLGYSIAPTIILDGGDPDTDATLEATFDKKTGTITAISVVENGEGLNYSTVPTLTIAGGGGAGGELRLNIKALEGNILVGGSGYTPGVYIAESFTGGNPDAAATATFTVAGLSGSITNPGSGYQDGNYQNIPVANDPTATYVLTVVNRDFVQYNSLSGGTFAVGDTITGSVSGATATVTSARRTSNTDGDLKFATVTNGPFSSGETLDNGSGVTATMINNQASTDVFVVDGTEAPVLPLSTHNTYRFDDSDPSCNGHQIDVAGLLSSGTVVIQRFGTVGDGGSETFTEVVLKDNATPSSNFGDYVYYCTSHGVVMGNDVTVTSGSGSPGVYGSGISATIEVSSGQFTTVTLTNQGTGYKVSDTFTIINSSLGGTGGTGFVYTVTGNDTSISSVTDISYTGGPYTTADVLSVNLPGSGSGFQFAVTKGGFLDTVEILTPGFGYSPSDNLTILNLPETTGNEISLRVATVVDRIPIEVGYNGAITSLNWSINELGSAVLPGGISSGAINASAITSTGTLQTATLTSGSASITGAANIATLTTTTASTLASSTIKLADGSAVAPTLAFQNSTGTGLYRAGSNDIGLSISGTQRGSISASGFDLSTDLVVDQNLAELTPFFRVNAVGESVDIGAATTQLRINNDASIEAIGSNANVDITFIPKGTGNLILTGGTDKDFSITDGSTETFKVDTDTGNTTVGGRLDINGNVRIEDNIIASTIAQSATTSFGQIITISATGTGTGFTDNTYIGVTSTSDGSGTGATFDVTVSGGDITAISINAGGAGYSEGEEITLNPSTVGAGTGKTITVTDIEGAGLVLRPSTGKNVKVASTAMFVVPAGNTNQRPSAGDRQVGGVRFNTEQQQFEGYNGTDFVSLGGVRDVNQDTYILTEQSPGSNEDTFFFYNQGVNSLDIVQDKFKLYTAKTFDTSGTLRLNGVNIGDDALDVLTLNNSVLKVRSRKDVEVTGGLRFKSVPVLGEVATIGSITSGTGVYTPSQTFSAVTTTSQFEGSGSTFDVVIDGSGSVQSVTLIAAGSGYEVDEIITIDGSLLGGATPANDVTFPVATLANTTGTFARLDILQQDYVTQLDSKPFLSLDANGAQAAWKINRGWNAGTESYLTVMDSTADFVELDDCRVEGGQLTSFTASSTLVQFDKTAYKGAKTLVTIESDDGKVHMLEVTSVCAAAGTNAYATVTNSVTSDNDLVDASIAVVGNNVQVTVTKSSAATSSTTFTGRFTTTKVKV